MPEKEKKKMKSLPQIIVERLQQHKDLRLGNSIRTVDDFVVLLNSVANSFRDSVPDNEDFRNFSKIAKEGLAGTDLGTIMSAIILSYPKALYARAKEDRSHFWRIYGEAGSGKTKSSNEVAKTLLNLHLQAQLGLEKGDKKEDLAKSIAKQAEEYFKPYTQFIGNDKIDWNKWAKDFVDSVEEYSNAEYTPIVTKLKDLTTASRTVMDTLPVNRTLPAYVQGDQSAATIRDAHKMLPPISVFDDVYGNMTKRDEDKFQNIMNKIGDASFTAAVVVDTENIQDRTFRNQIRDLDSEGRRGRFGLGFKINEKNEEAFNRLITEGLKFTNELSKLFTKVKYMELLSEAMKNENGLAYERLVKDLSINLGSRSEAEKFLKNTIKSLEKVFGRDASEQLKENINIFYTYVSNEDLETIHNENNRYFKNSHYDLFETVVNHTLEMKLGNEEKAFQKAEDFGDTVAKFMNNLGHVYDSVGEKKNSGENKIIRAELGSFDKFEKLAKQINPERYKHELKKPEIPEGRKEEKIQPKKVSYARKLMSSIHEKSLEAARKLFENLNNDEVGKNILATIIAQSAKEELRKENSQKYMFAHRYENANACPVRLNQVGDDHLVLLGKTSDNKYIYFNKKFFSPKNRRLIQLAENIEAFMKYLPEKDARVFARELILGAYGASLTSHILMSAFGVYEKSGERAKTIRSIDDAFIDLAKKYNTVQEKYNEEDIKQFIQSIEPHSEKLSKEFDQRAIQATLQHHIDNLIDEDGNLNERSYNIATGIAIANDMLNKYFTEKAGDDEDKLRELLYDLTGGKNILMSFLKNFSNTTDPINFRQLENHEKQAIENRLKNKICPEVKNKGADALIDKIKQHAPKTLNHTGFSLSILRQTLARRFPLSKPV